MRVLCVGAALVAAAAAAGAMLAAPARAPEVRVAVTSADSAGRPAEVVVLIRAGARVAFGGSSVRARADTVRLRTPAEIVLGDGPAALELWGAPRAPRFRLAYALGWQRQTVESPAGGAAPVTVQRAAGGALSATGGSMRAEF